MKQTNTFWLLLILFGIGCNKKDDTTPPVSDFRDEFTGAYRTSSYSWARYPTPPTYFDTTYVNNDTVYITVEKNTADALSLIIMGDTLTQVSPSSFRSGSGHFEHIVSFWEDSLQYIVHTGGSPASSFGTGYIGKKL